MPSFLQPDLAAVELYAAKIGLPPTEAQKFYDYYESNGWRVGKNPMRSWEAAIRNWKRNREQYTFHQNGHASGAQVVVMQKEYERICERMKVIAGQYGDHQTWTYKDRDYFNQLKARRDELKKALNILL